MTEAVIWLVIWALIFLAMPTVTVLTFIGLGGVGAVKAKTEKGKTRSVVAAFILVGLGGVIFWVVSAINAVIQLVTVIQLL
jgi:hypothetical protein